MPKTIDQLDQTAVIEPARPHRGPRTTGGEGQGAREEVP